MQLQILELHLKASSRRPPAPTVRAAVQFGWFGAIGSVWWRKSPQRGSFCRFRCSIPKANRPYPIPMRYPESAKDGRNSAKQGESWPRAADCKSHARPIPSLSADVPSAIVKRNAPDSLASPEAAESSALSYVQTGTLMRSLGSGLAPVVPEVCSPAFRCPGIDALGGGEFRRDLDRRVHHRLGRVHHRLDSDVLRPDHAALAGSSSGPPRPRSICPRSAGVAKNWTVSGSPSALTWKPV